MAGSDPAFLGTGWGFPPTFSRHPLGVGMVAGVEDIRESLRILFATARGERVMLPGYGCDLWQMVFRALTTTLTTEIRDVLATAILRWEPRIDVEAIAVRRDDATAGLVWIEVDFTVRQTNNRANLVYPFYLTEATLADTLPIDPGS